MNFVFVDETGEPGRRAGGSAHFGMALLCVKDDDYESIRGLLSQIHWLSGTARVVEIGPDPFLPCMLLRGLRELANNRFLSASGLFISKADYGGRYLNWSDYNIPPSEWSYYLRNYLLRHLLEFHFEKTDQFSEPIDLVLDRLMLTEDQRQNTLGYLRSEAPIPLIRPFSIPEVRHLTIADSEYVGGLEITHVFADIVREHAKGTINRTVASLADFMPIQHFVGPKER